MYLLRLGNSSIPSRAIPSRAVRRYVSTFGGEAGVKIRPKRRRLIAVGLAGAGTLGAVYWTNEEFATSMRHISLAGQRVATVSRACFRCFTAYRAVLNENYNSDEEYSSAMSECHTKCALITRKAIEKNAGLFIKLGQHIAALTYIFPQEWTDAMIPLQDKCPTSSYESVEHLFEADTGSTIEEVFDTFDRAPLGTASLAQVHRATLKSTGEEVAVKVQHPALEEFVPLDVLMTRVVFNMIDYFFPEYPLGWLGDELQNSIFVELDFREEGKNAMKTKAYFKEFYGVTALRIPNVIWSRRRILVMEYILGGRIDDQEFLKAHNISPSDVSACLSHTFNNMIFTPGVGLHCDPHPGNLSIIPIPKTHGGHNFEIVLYDHGLYRDVPTAVRRSYAHFWLALLEGNDEDMRYYAKEFAHVSDDNFQLFAAAITGRDLDNATSNVVSKRSNDEILKMSTAITEGGLLSQIMVLLHSMPRIVLLILKTNDLTRYLDQCLASPLGPERTFLIMATYCARTVFYEGRELIARQFNGHWSFRRLIAEVTNWWAYFYRTSKLTLYDIGLTLKRS